MSDDRSSLTGKRAALGGKDKEATPDPRFGNVGLVVRVTESDIRMVESYYHELALEASQDKSPPTPEEQVTLQKLAASFERLKAMTREELLAERARRLRQRRRLE
jgi:hypothetical protein